MQYSNMLNRADIKYLNSLQNKKYRKIEHAFLVEGLKNVYELLHSDYQISRVFCTEKVFDEVSPIAKLKKLECEIVSEKELNAIGTLEKNQTASALAFMKEPQKLSFDASPLTLVLDNINDPGNLGTIIRIADWYGIKNIICSPDTVDFYNPKVIHATKGSFTRVNVSHEILSSFLSIAITEGIAILAASLEGTSIYRVAPPLPAVLIMGNEANGISKELLQLTTHRLHIPRLGQAESLNVGVATGILVDRLLGDK